MNYSDFMQIMSGETSHNKNNWYSPIHLPQVVMSIDVVWRVPDGGQEVALRLLSAAHECPQVIMGTRISWPQSTTEKIIDYNQGCTG
jgi:hypothetical protein